MHGDTDDLNVNRFRFPGTCGKREDQATETASKAKAPSVGECPVRVVVDREAETSLR
jgi:hypothetical protein